ncbi:MAG: MarR family winged helix-turn-helix transcriptional regulator [Gammaproteobacteria bacterium]
MRDPDQSVGFLVNDVARLLRRNFNRRAQELGLSQAQWQALAYLSRQEGVNQVTLAESLDIQPMTLARLIDRLQEAGLVARRPDPGDRRAFRLYLTEDAQPLLGRMWDIAAETREDAMAGLADDRKQVLIDALRHMKRNLVAAESAADGIGGEPEKALSNAAGSV